MSPSDDYKKKVIKRYDGFSKYYDSLDTGLVQTTVERRKKAVGLLNVQPDHIVLDVGTGSGLVLPWIAKKLISGKVYGADLSTGMLEKARERLTPDIVDRVELKVEDIEAMTFDDDFFDSMIATYTLTTVPDPWKMMRECYRVLKPGGVFVMLDTGPPSKKRGIPVYLWMRLSAILFGYTKINRRLEDYLPPGLVIESEERFYGYTVYLTVMRKIK